MSRWFLGGQDRTTQTRAQKFNPNSRGESELQPRPSVGGGPAQGLCYFGSRVPTSNSSGVQVSAGELVSWRNGAPDVIVDQRALGVSAARGYELGQVEVDDGDRFLR